MNTIEIETFQHAESATQTRGAVVEIRLLLEVRQLAALEAAASAHGLTTAGMTRRLIHDFIQQTHDGAR